MPVLQLLHIHTQNYNQLCTIKPPNFKGKFQGTYLINLGWPWYIHGLGWPWYIHGLDVGAVLPSPLYKTQAEIDCGNLLLVM